MIYVIEIGIERKRRAERPQLLAREWNDRASVSVYWCMTVSPRSGTTRAASSSLADLLTYRRSSVLFMLSRPARYHAGVSAQL